MQGNLNELRKNGAQCITFLTIMKTGGGGESNFAYKMRGKVKKALFISRFSLEYRSTSSHNILQEFILNNAENRKSQSSNLQDGSSKKSLADFKLVTFQICLLDQFASILADLDCILHADG